MEKIVAVLLAMVMFIAVPCLAFDFPGHEGQIPLCQNNKTGRSRLAPVKDIDPTTGVNYQPYCNTRFFYGTTTPAETLIWVDIQGSHPAVGAWFGMAVEDCIGDPATNCGGLGLPAITMFMTASFFADGNFLGNDSLAIGSAPFGPHTTAHGQWVQTSPDGLVADVVFLLPAPISSSTSGVHIKYSATVISPMEMVGYVNIYVAFPPLSLAWQQLGPGEFPTLSDTANALVAAPEGIFTQQSQCTAVGCPLVFRFTAQRGTSRNTSP